MSTVTVPPVADRVRMMDAASEALLQQLVNATPAQITTWLNANVTDLASARTVLHALAVGLRYLYLKGQ